MTDVIIYTRFSPRPDSDTTESCETQEEQCRDYARNRQWLIRAVYEDRSHSGSELDRPGLWDAVESLRARWVLLVYRCDRLARDVYLDHLIRRRVTQRGARIYSVCGEGTWTDSPEDELIRNVLSCLAEYQRKANAARTKAAMRRHQLSGRRMGSVCPYGWRDDPSNAARMLPNDEERETMAIIASLAEEGMHLRAIARELAILGRRSRSGALWHPQSIARILRSDLLARLHASDGTGTVGVSEPDA